MASLDTKGLDALIADMEKAGKLMDTDLVDEMLMAGAKEVANVWKSVAEAHGYRDTGAMIESIGYAKQPHSLDEARAIEIYPQGKDKKTGVRNAEKAFRLHYGWSKYNGTHWVDEVEENAGVPAVEAMRAIFEKRMNNI